MDYAPRDAELNGDGGDWAMASLDEVLKRLDAIERRMDVMHEDIRRTAQTVSRIKLKLGEDASLPPRSVGNSADPEK